MFPLVRMYSPRFAIALVHDIFGMVNESRVDYVYIAALPCSEWDQQVPFNIQET